MKKNIFYYGHKRKHLSGVISWNFCEFSANLELRTIFIVNWFQLFRELFRYSVFRRISIENQYVQTSKDIFSKTRDLCFQKTAVCPSEKRLHTSECTDSNQNGQIARKTIVDSAEGVKSIVGAANILSDPNPLLH